MFRPVAVELLPVASVKTTPLTISGVAGEVRSAETHPGVRERAARVEQLQRNDRAGGHGPVRGGARRGEAARYRHEDPGCPCCRIRLLPGRERSAHRGACAHDRLRGMKRRRMIRATKDAASSRRMRRPCGRATMSLPLWRRIVGPVTNSAAGCVNQSFNCSVFASSATIAFALPSPVVLPAPIAATRVPSDVKATSPITSPPLVFHDTTGFASLSRSMAHTHWARRRSFLMSPHRASCQPQRARTIGRWQAGNGAGRWRSLPDARPSTCSMPSLETT